MDLRIDSPGDGLANGIESINQPNLLSGTRSRARQAYAGLPYSEDAVCIYVSEEKVLFLGDSTSEDYFNGGFMDKGKLDALVRMIRSTDCRYCILSHCEPLSKEDLLSYLEGIL